MRWKGSLYDCMHTGKGCDGLDMGGGLRDPQLVLHSCAEHMGVTIWAESVCEIYHSAS